MKKETIITAIVFFGVGFLAGYIYDAQTKSNAQQNLTLPAVPHAQSEASTTRASNPPPDETRAGLPEGHPPLETAAVIKTLEDEAAQSPSDPEPRLRLANFFYDQKQYDKAIEWYRKTLDLDPKNINARTDLGTAYFYIGRLHDALNEFHKSLETDPKHEPTLFNIIVVTLEGTRDLTGAQEALERLQKLNPNYPGLDNLKQRLEAARASEGVAPARR